MKKIAVIVPVYNGEKFLPEFMTKQLTILKYIL